MRFLNDTNTTMQSPVFGAAAMRPASRMYSPMPTLRFDGEYPYERERPKVKPTAQEHIRAEFTQRQQRLAILTFIIGKVVLFGGFALLRLSTLITQPKEAFSAILSPSNWLMPLFVIALTSASLSVLTAFGFFDLCSVRPLGIKRLKSFLLMATHSLLRTPRQFASRLILTLFCGAAFVVVRMALSTLDTHVYSDDVERLFDIVVLCTALHCMYSFVITEAACISVERKRSVGQQLDIFLMPSFVGSTLYSESIKALAKTLLVLAAVYPTVAMLYSLLNASSWTNLLSFLKPFLSLGAIYSAVVLTLTLNMLFVLHIRIARILFTERIYFKLPPECSYPHYAKQTIICTLFDALEQSSQSSLVRYYASHALCDAVKMRPTERAVCFTIRGEIATFFVMIALLKV